MQRITRAAVAGALAIGLVAGVTPAQAYTTYISNFAFVGTATVAPGLATPLVPALLGGQHGRDGTWTFTNFGSLPHIGVGVAVANPPVPDTPVPYAGSVWIEASGELHGGLVNVFGPGAFCRLSGGSNGVGRIKIRNFVGPRASSDLRNVGWFQSAATVTAYSGDTTFDDDPGSGVSTRVGGALVGVFSALPPIAGVIGAGSCDDGTATQLSIVGVGVASFTTNP